MRISFMRTYEHRYRLHKASGQAICVIKRKTIYLGKYDSPGSHKKYAEVMESLKDGRPIVTDPTGLTVAESAVLYLDHAERYYRTPDGEDTRQTPRIRRAFQTLVKLHAEVRLNDLLPRHIRDCQRQWVTEGLSRTYCNHLLVVCKTAIKWLAREGLMSSQRWLDISIVEGLKKGRTTAREAEETTPVEDEVLRATLPHLSETIRDMVMVQLFSGCRTGELVSMTWDQIVETADGMIYRPRRHKNQWRGHQRTIFIGPQAREIIEKYRGQKGVLFHYKRRPYKCSSYCKNITRVCVKNGIKPWRPGQLRHNAATIIQQTLGWDAARAVLGHRTVSTTRIYADSDGKVAAEAAKRLG
jgi:integrase